MQKFGQNFGFVAIVALMASAGAGQAASDKQARCDRSTAIVMQSVEARKNGASERQARSTLRKALGNTAGVELSKWLYALPMEQLTPEIGEMWTAQCLAQLD